MLFKTRKQSSLCSLLLTALFAWMALVPSVAYQQTPPAPVFQLELPELGLAPTDKPELMIPSPNLNIILIHVLRPQADTIDYNQIFTFINREATATIASVSPTERGKLIRLELNLRPDIKLVPGRNTVEVRAENRRGRTFYSSFVLRTTTGNYNQDFAYSVDLNRNLKVQAPPELYLVEPERQIELPRGRTSQMARISGVATAATGILTVTVNGQPAPLKRGAQVTMRRLGLVNEGNRVTFDTSIMVTPTMTQVTIEALDTSGNRTQLQIPVKAIDAAPAPTEFHGKKYALIIGISKFRDADYNLEYADTDARSMQEFLLTPAGGRFPQANMMVLLNEQATLQHIRDAMTNFAVQPGPDDLLLIFVAGHGGPDPAAQQNLYFLAHDSQIDRLAETALPMKDLQSLLQQNVRARRLVLLVDTCRSAGLTGGEMMRGLRNNLVNIYTEKLLYREEGKAVITSSDVNEDSAEGPRWGGGHGVFTYFLLEGLQGKADVNSDRLVTVGELFRFVRQKVGLETQFRQNPRILTSVNENLALAFVPPSAPTR